MKKIFTLTVVLAAALTLSSCDCFKKMAKNPDAIQVSCTPEVLVLNNGKIAADLSASIPADYFNVKAALKVTPVLFFEGGAVAGETILLQGEKIEANGLVVVKDEVMTLNRHIEFDYQPAMDACELKLLVEVKCKSGKCKEFTLVNANTGAILTAEQLEVIAKNDEAAYALKSECGRKVAVGLNVLQKDIDFASAMATEQNNYKNVNTTVVTADLVYKINSSVLSKKATETEEVAALKSSVEGYLNNDRAAQSVYVKGYASPDGPEKFNDKLSDKRSQSGLKAVQKLLAETGLNIDAAAYGEDWDGFKAAVAASNIQDKDLILQVLGMYTSSAEREKEIKNLASVFGALKTDVLPQLRRAQIVNTIDVTGKTDAEMVALIKEGRVAELNLEELLHIAEAQPEVAEVALKAAAETYNDARAYNNLAITLAKQGDFDGALKALDKAAKAGSKSEELNDNYALVYLAMGETDKAASYAQGANAEVQALAAAAKGEYAAASKNLEGYNAAIVQVQEGNLAAAKNSIANDESAKADYLRAVIAAKEGNVEAAKAALQTAISKDASLAKKAAKDVNLAALR
jgi:outer membrane protein OmpA-like peptidoglycan-associated protein/Flp pilus assembly protein TadD